MKRRKDFSDRPTIDPSSYRANPIVTIPAPTETTDTSPKPRPMSMPPGFIPMNFANQVKGVQLKKTEKKEDKKEIPVQPTPFPVQLKHVTKDKQEKPTPEDKPQQEDLVPTNQEKKEEVKEESVTEEAKQETVTDPAPVGSKALLFTV